MLTLVQNLHTLLPRCCCCVGARHKVRLLVVFTGNVALAYARAFAGNSDNAPSSTSVVSNIFCPVCIVSYIFAGKF